jgi:Ca-activated chloride channel family protein
MQKRQEPWHDGPPTMPLFTKIFTIILLLLSACSVGAAQEKKKIVYGVLVDNTGSLRSQFDDVKEIGKAVARQTFGHGPVSLFVFESGGRGPGGNARPKVRVDGSQDEDQLIQAIDTLYVQAGQTTLLDAIELMAERLHQDAGAADKVLVLITDGEERSSDIRQKTLMQKLKDLKIKVFAVGLIQELGSERGFIRQSPRSKATDLLRSLAKETGGRAVFPKTPRPDLPKLLVDLAIPVQ